MAMRRWQDMVVPLGSWGFNETPSITHGRRSCHFISHMPKSLRFKGSRGGHTVTAPITAGRLRLGRWRWPGAPRWRGGRPAVSCAPVAGGSWPEGLQLNDVMLGFARVELAPG